MSDRIEKSPFVSILTLEQTKSPTWQVIRAFVLQEIEGLRRLNDDRKRDIVDTSHIRGGIHAYKQFLEAVEPPELLPTRKPKRSE